MNLPRSNAFRSQTVDFQHPNELLPHQLCHVQVGPNCPCGEKSIKHTLESWDSFQLTYVYTIVLEDYHYHYPTWTTKSLKINPTTQSKKAPNFHKFAISGFTWIYFFEGFPISPLGHLLHSLNDCRCVCFFRCMFWKHPGIVDRSPLQGIFRNSFFGISGISCTQFPARKDIVSGFCCQDLHPAFPWRLHALQGESESNLRISSLRKPLRLVGSGNRWIVATQPPMTNEELFRAFWWPQKTEKKNMATKCRRDLFLFGRCAYNIFLLWEANAFKQPRKKNRIFKSM